MLSVFPSEYIHVLCPVESVDKRVLCAGDCSIKDGKLGIHMTMSREGRPSGEAYVEMETDEDIEKACKKDRDHMGHRYIEGMCA
jgi:heterogeneous nuclear ribonucleoprotein F/H